MFNDSKYDFVFNLCGETRFGLSDKDYQTKCVDTAGQCCVAAEKAGVRRWIEVSTAQVYKPDKVSAEAHAGNARHDAMRRSFVICDAFFSPRRMSVHR